MNCPSGLRKLFLSFRFIKGEENSQSFGEVQNAFIRAEDVKGKEMMRFDLTGGAQYEDCRSMLFAELIREPEGWKFNAIGSPSQSDSYINWLEQYM